MVYTFTPDAAEGWERFSAPWRWSPNDPAKNFPPTVRLVSLQATSSPLHPQHMASDGVTELGWGDELQMLFRNPQASLPAS